MEPPGNPGRFNLLEREAVLVLDVAKPASHIEATVGASVLVERQSRDGYPTPIRIGGPDVARDLGEPHLLGGPPPPLAVDDLVLAIRLPQHLDGLQEPEDTDRVAKRDEVFVLNDDAVPTVRNDGGDRQDSPYDGTIRPQRDSG